ncbi:hypothetical protein P170DRAFT_493481 [Aspergillus steynii IBT 23096]|uniref:DUF7770 domain-containing protein n=1 Tax=Aspergillus steynii IBT 23096 TaxID=1392250 RepID=A0A2I2GED9_9EURO|nr:uncharacterized protein P170DRAFT_493481 [Aspergillus steynii IBT 23096]PLB51222.1 hypothetical protein P170DRAFT_493481 [Aspergillus steynii IBT 23096]
MTSILSPQAAQADSTRITHARVVAHTVDKSKPKARENHWSIYLLHQDGKSSTRINIRAENGKQTGLLEWTQHDYTKATSAVIYLEYEALEGVTVSSVAHVIYRLGRDTHMMAEGGSRAWVYYIIDDLAQNSCISPSSPYHLWPNLSFLYLRDESDTDHRKSS